MEGRFKTARNHHRSMKINRGLCFSSWRLIHDNFKKLDKFGHPITLTYKGRDHFQTPWGACISILVFLTMTWVIFLMVGQMITQPFQRRQVVKELIDPGLSVQGAATYNETHTLSDIDDIISFTNFDSFTDREFNVSFVRSGEATAERTFSKDSIFKNCPKQESQSCFNLAEQPITLYESQKVMTYDTLSDNYEGSEYLQVRFSPCREIDETAVREGLQEARCSDADTRREILTGHKLRVRVKQFDENENAYWTETPVPQITKGISIFIREVTTINEDYHYLLGYPILSKFIEFGDVPGVTKSYVIGNIINDHSPTVDLDNVDDQDFSFSIYLRQDPFKETVYILRYNVLFLLAQLMGALTLLNFLGYVLTSFWTSRLYNASMIKHLYKVKHTSAGRQIPSSLTSKLAPNENDSMKAGDKKKVSPIVDQRPVQSSGARISNLWERLDGIKLKRLRANVMSWKQIDKQDIKNLLTALLNRRRLSLSAKQIFRRLFCCCFCRDRNSRYLRLYDHGEKRLRTKELEVKKIVQSARRSKLLSRTLLNQRQQLLLKYQKYEMLDTEESSSDTDADWRKLESKNNFLRLLALGKARNTMNQYLLQDIDGLDVKLLFGVYQNKVLGYEERLEEQPDILDKILGAKKIARQMYKQKPGAVPDEATLREGEAEGGVDQAPEPIQEPPQEPEKFAKNDPRLKASQKSYLAQFYVKPSYNLNQSISTHAANPTPLDIGKGEYVDNPVVASLSPRNIDNIALDYNLNFEPYASKYDNKLVVDNEAGEIIGVQPRRMSEKPGQSSPRGGGEAKSNFELQFDFSGPKRTSDERHYFKTIQEDYSKQISSKKNSLSDLMGKQF